MESVRRRLGETAGRVARGHLPESVYRLVLPEYVRLELREETADFHTSGASLGYDFRDDFASEKEILTDFVGELNEGDVVYDIGANVGLYAAFAGNVIGSGHAVAFEPQPAVTPVLRRNLDANCEGYDVVQLALSDGSGFGEIQAVPSTDATIRATDGIHVPLRRLSDVIEDGEFPPPTVMKIDVEGAEKEVLSGADAYLSEVDLLYLELHHEKVGAFGSEDYRVEPRLNETFDAVTTLGDQKRSTTVTHIKATDR